MESPLGRREPRRPVTPAPAGRVRRPELAAAGRVVVKLGTRVLVDPDGRPLRGSLESLVGSVLALRLAGRQVIVVTSGAIGLGRGLLGLPASAGGADGRRACAAVGQAALQALYRDAFAAHGLLTAQVLLTGHDFARRRQPRVWATFERLLAAGVVLVVNENDAVTHGTEGVRSVFRDNDGLAALVATGCRADLLVLLTDVAGVFDVDPGRHPEARPFDRVEDAEGLLARLAAPREDDVSRGGMRSKVAAAAFAARGGCRTVIASGSEPDVLARVAAGQPLGTYFPTEETP